MTASSSSTLCINAFSFYLYDDVSVKCYQKWADTELKFQLFLPLVVDGMSCVYPLHYYFYLLCTVFIYPLFVQFLSSLYCVYPHLSSLYLLCTVLTPICPIFISSLLCLPPSVLFVSPPYCVYPYLSYFHLL